MAKAIKKVDKVTHKFVAYKLPSVTDLHQTVDKDKQFGQFVYAQHSIVIYWNMPDHLIPVFTKAEKLDEFTIEVDSSATPTVEFNKLILNRLTIDRVHVVASVLAQSVMLEALEKQADQLLRDVTLFAGKISIFKSMNKFIAQSIITRNTIIGDLKLLDRPDLIWGDRTMDSLFNDLRNMFDLEERFDTVTEKLSAVQDTLTILSNLSATKRSLILEALIVILVAAEGFLMLIK